jgi:hypothetical protein
MGGEKVDVRQRSTELPQWPFGLQLGGGGMLPMSRKFTRFRTAKCSCNDRSEQCGANVMLQTTSPGLLRGHPSMTVHRMVSHKAYLALAQTFFYRLLFSPELYRFLKAQVIHRCASARMLPPIC